MEGINTNGLNSEDKDVTPTNKDEETCSNKKPAYPPLLEEPEANQSLLCQVGFRLPDGRKMQCSFLCSDPIQVTIHCGQWPLLSSPFTRPFRLTHAIPGASKTLDYDSQLTFEESGLANLIISVTWE
ncbi:hypothetical protein UlMin_026503 [Ulmus minor]